MQKGRGGLRGDLVLLQAVGQREAELRVDQRVAEGERAAARALREVVEHPQLVEQIAGEADRAVEQVGLVVAQVDQHADAAQLAIEGQRLAVAEQVGLLDLGRGDEILDAGEAGAHLERSGRLLRHLDHDADGVVDLTLRGQIDALEVAERRDAAA